jgi:hypothetical protein
MPRQLIIGFDGKNYYHRARDGTEKRVKEV